MRRLFSRNAKLALAVLPVAVGCAIAQGGEPPDPVLNPGAGGEEETGGTGMTGGSGGSGGSGISGASGSGTSGTTSGGSGGSTSTGGSGGSATGGSATGGSAGSAVTGGTAGKATGGTAGSATTGGTAGTAAGGKGGTAGTAAGGKGGTAGTAPGGMGGGAAGGPPGGMVLLRDDFEMGTGNWTASPAANWAIATDGTMVYAATAAQANTNWRVAYAGETTWTDVQIDARVKVTPNWAGMGSGYYAGICARYQSASAFACFALRSNGQIMFRVGGSNTGATNMPSGPIVRDMWYRIRVVARGANITAFVNDTEIPAGSRVTSGAPTSGRIALAAPGTDAVFDDIVVTTP